MSDSPLRQQITEALTAEHYRRARERIVDSPEGHCAAMADAVLAVILPAAGITATLARMADADITRVIALYEQWVKAGPPPIGTPMARWWDRRLAELHDAILPPDQTGCRCHNGDELCSGCRRCPDICHGCDGPKRQASGQSMTRAAKEAAGYTDSYQWPGPDSGPSVAEAAAHDRRWPLEKAGE